jgi:hypothetical protein
MLRRYLGADATDLALILRRGQEDVAAKRKELARKIGCSDPLTREQVNEFKRVYGTRSDADLAVIFGRTVEMVRDYAARLRLSKDKAWRKKQGGKTKMPRWSRAEVETLRLRYSMHSNQAIAEALGRSIKSVVSKADNLGLKKSYERLREMGRENVRVRYE